jgi:hypothetical protein
MKRIVTVILAAVEVFAVATAGLALIAVPVLTVWLISYGLQGDPGFVFGLIADLWFFGHGVPLGVDLEPATAAALGLPASAVSATFSLFPLGFMLFTAASAARMGKRFAGLSLNDAIWGGATALVTIAVMSWALALVAPRPPLQFGVFGSMMMPTLVFFVGLLVGFVLASIRDDVAWLSRLRHRVLQNISESWVWVSQSALVGLRVGWFALVGLVAASALVFAIRLTVSYVGVVSVSQQLQLDVLGIIVMFLVNLAYLPTMLIWTASWMIGPGFSIGEGTSVSALSTQLGPIPSVPIFGIVPTGDHPWGLAIISIVLVVALVATLGVLRDLQRSGGSRPTVRSFLVIAFVAALISGAVIALAMGIANGSLGAGRLEITGPNPWLVAGVGSAEIFFGVLFGAWLSTVEWDRLATAALERTEPLRETKFMTWMTSRSSRAEPGSRAEVDSTVHPGSNGESSSSSADQNETVELSDFTPWWSEKDDKL